MIEVARLDLNIMTHGKHKSKPSRNRKARKNFQFEDGGSRADMKSPHRFPRRRAAFEDAIEDDTDDRMLRQ